MRRKKKIIFATIPILLLLCLVGEFILRGVFGFCDAPLFAESDEWEYMAQPNQCRHRFGNTYVTNSYAQRSEEPDSSKKIVLGLGDSVINGGTMIDNDSLATSLFGERNEGWQMLNISAGSWGPDNCAAYLRHYGLFGAKAIILVVSSHDAHDVMSFVPIVGRAANYPNRQYKLAWWELIDRYLWPRLSSNLHANRSNNVDPDYQVSSAVGRKKKDGRGIVKGHGKLNPGFDQLKQMADSADIPLTVYLHADLDELGNGDYNSQGYEIMSWADSLNVPIIKELDYHFSSLCYRDGIHLSEKGQYMMAEILTSKIVR